MTSLEGVAGALPSRSVPIDALREELGLSPAQIKMFQRFYGLSHVRRDPDSDIAELMLNAAGKLDALHGREHLVRYVIQARTLQAVAPYPITPVQDVRRTLGLDHAISFTVTQHACASGLLAVELSGRMLASDGDPNALALVLTGEKTFTPSAQMISETAIMGEGTAAALVGLGGARDRLLGYATRTHGRYSEGLTLPKELATEFQRSYQESLAEVIHAAVRKAGLDLTEIDLILPHNVNRVSWVRLCKQMGIPVEKVLLDNVPVTGHCYGADSFINYQTACEQGRLHPGERYLMAAVGLGATFSAMIFEH